VTAAVGLPVATYAVVQRVMLWEKDFALFFLILGGATVVEVLLTRSVAAYQTRHTPPKRNTLVLGAGWGGRLVADTIIHQPNLHLRVAGFVDAGQNGDFRHKGLSVVGTPRQLSEQVERHDAKLVVLAGELNGDADLVNTLVGLRLKGVEVMDLPDFYEAATGQIPIQHVEDRWFLHARGFELLHRPEMQKVKRLFDVLAASFGFVLSLPLMVLVAALVKIESRGPALFRQERTGKDGKAFEILKFRSMSSDAEKGTGPVWASRKDDRITRVGRFLRLTRLDEIPQFINILRGDMSFIGPRPERPYFVEQLKKEIPYYAFRHAVRPGLTGWAQVKYRYGASTEDAVEKLKYDLYYVKNMSFGLDLRIMVKTLKVVLFARGN
jgi:sugar transferase (PEP-CTERM system associated)